MSATLADVQPRDRQIADMGRAVNTRAIKTCGLNRRQIERHQPPQESDWNQFNEMSMPDISRACLIVDGFDEHAVKSASPEAVVHAAMGFATRELRSEAAYHVTSTFPNLLMDASDKTFLARYEEAPSTWARVMSRGKPVDDFKDIHRIQIGEIPNLPIWLDNLDPDVAALPDEKTTYAVEAYAKSVDYSWRAIINDDLGALAGTVGALGAAARRTENAVAWNEWVRRPAMNDGQTTFLESPTGQRYRSNLTTGVAIPDVATLNVMKTKMKLMRGLNTPEGNESDAILGLTPDVLIVPSSLMEDAQQVTESSADPDGAHEAVHNPWFGTDKVIEPLLDTDSTTAFYLAVAPGRGQAQTVEVTHLSGHERPQFDQHRDPGTLSLRLTVRQTYAAKWLDYRAVQRHDGQ